MKISIYTDPPAKKDKGGTILYLGGPVFMNRKKRRLFTRSAALALAATMLLTTGCASKDNDEQELLTLIVKSGDEYWDAIIKGAEDACEEMGYKLNVLEPEYENSSIQQRRFIEQAVADGSSAIIIAPANDNELNETLEESAMAANVPVISIESDMSYAAKETLIATNQISAGGIAARALLSLRPEGGQVAIITHNPDALIAKERIESFLDNIPYTDESGSNDDDLDETKGPEVPEYAPFSLVATKNCDNNADIAALNTKQLIEAYPDLKVIFCTNQMSTIGVCRGVEQAGKSGFITVIGFDASDEQIEFIKNGTLTGTVVQNLYNMGYLGIRYADKLLEGEEIPPNIDTGAAFVTKGNLDNPDVQLLLNPTDN